MNAKLQKQLEGLSARVAKLQEDFGVIKKGGTPGNSPRIESVDGQRDVISELVAAAVDRGNAQVRTALLRSPAFLALMRSVEKDPLIQRVLVEAVLEAEIAAGGPQEEDLAEPVEPFDHQAFEEARARGKRVQLAREIVRKGGVGDILDFRIAKGHAQQLFAAVQAIADHLARGGKDVSAADVAKAVADSKQARAPMADYSLQKSATDKTPVDARDERPKRIQNPELVLNRR